MGGVTPPFFHKGVKIIKLSKEEKEKIKFMLDNRTWSFSSVNCYSNCPKCFCLSYLQDPPLEKVNNAFAQWGTLGHSLFERYVNGELELFELGDRYEEEYDEAVTLPFPPNKYVDLNDSYHDNGRNYFENWNGFPDDWELVESEKEIHLTINGNAFIGFIDLIVRDKKTGDYIIVDHKSKSKFKNDEEKAEYARQLYLYSLHIKEEFGEYPTYLIFNMFRANDEVKIKFNEEELGEAVKWFTDTIETIKKDTSFKDKIALEYRKKGKPLKDYKKNDYFCCYLCSVRNSCLRSKDYKRE